MNVTLTPTRDRHVLHYGVGYNWFDHLGMGGFFARSRAYRLDEPVFPPLADQKSWSAIIEELDRLRPGFIRFGLPPDPHLDAAGRIVKDTPHLERLDRVARWAAQHGCTILLDTFLLPTRFEMPVPPALLENPDSFVQMAALDNRAFAREFVAPLLDHICRERRLEAVRLFNPVNEPMLYGVYQTPGNQPDALVHYVEMYREMRAALDEAGLPSSRLGLAGVDCVQPEHFPALEMVAKGIDINPFLEAYTIHYYGLRFDSLPPRPEHCLSSPLEEVMDKHTAKLVRYCRARGKRLLAAEIGTFYYGWRNGDPAGACSLDAVLTVAEGVIRGLKAGLDAFAFWCLWNPNTVDGHWRIIGVENGEVIRSEYSHPVYGALSRHVRPGATVIPLQAETQPRSVCPLHAVALENAAGEHVVFMVNDHPEESARFEINLPSGWEKLPARCFTVNADQRGEETSSTASRHNELPPKTFRAYYGP
jgi:hypothetical protein